MYDWISRFKNGVAEAIKGGRCYKILRNGRRFDNVSDFDLTGFAWAVRKGEKFRIRRDGRRVS